MERENGRVLHVCKGLWHRLLTAFFLLIVVPNQNVGDRLVSDVLSLIMRVTAERFFLL